MTQDKYWLNFKYKRKSIKFTSSKFLRLIYLEMFENSVLSQKSYVGASCFNFDQCSHIIYAS